MKVIDNARSKQLELEKFPTYRTYNFGEKFILHVVLVHISNMKVSLSLDVTSTLLFAISGTSHTALSQFAGADALTN